MEQCSGTKEVEAASVARCPTKNLKAAALETLPSKEEVAESSSVAESSAAAAAASMEETKLFQKKAAAAGDEDATDSEDDDDEDGMTSLEYIKTYKLLPPHEVELILQRSLERTPFTDSYVYKALCADPSATQEDINLAYEDHEEQQDMRIEFRERVRREQEANGYVTVSDEYVTMRVRNEELADRLWEEAFADCCNLHGAVK